MRLALRNLRPNRRGGAVSLEYDPPAAEQLQPPERHECERLLAHACEEHRAVLRMRFLDGMTLVQIARVRGVSRQRIHQNQESAIKVIRKAVGL